MMVALLRLLDVTKVKDGGSLQKENRDHQNVLLTKLSN